MTNTMPSIYCTDEGQPISTQSMIKTFRRCPKQTWYKYVLRLKPRILSKPLTQGTWLHALMETKAKGGDWRTTHKVLTAKFAELFDEEREMLGDLPRECARIMRGYEWHYKDDVWKVHDVEFMLEAELPNGHIFRVKIDELIEDQWGLWLADHKFNANLPGLNSRILEIQAPMYVWVARRMGIPVNGFIWNYIRRKAPSVPKLTQAGRLSMAKCDTDYPTLKTALKNYGLDPTDAQRAWLTQLKSTRYVHGEAQRSPFYRRSVLELNTDQIKQVARETLHTSKRMHAYPFDRPDIVERSPDFQGCRNCSYNDICTLELFGGDTRNLRKQRYEEVDPMYYYNDDPKDLSARGE